MCVCICYIYIERERGWKWVWMGVKWVSNGCEMGVKCRFMCQQSWVVEGGMSWRDFLEVLFGHLQTCRKEAAGTSTDRGETGETPWGRTADMMGIDLTGIIMQRSGGCPSPTKKFGDELFLLFCLWCPLQYRRTPAPNIIYILHNPQVLECIGSIYECPSHEGVGDGINRSSHC